MEPFWNAGSDAGQDAFGTGPVSRNRLVQAHLTYAGSSRVSMELAELAAWIRCSRQTIPIFPGMQVGERIEKWCFRGAALAWVVLLSWESDRPGTVVHIQPPIDKVVHASAFGVLGFLLALGAGRFRGKILWLVPLMVSAFGFLDEFHQSFSPGRSVSALDWLADTVGGIAAAAAWWLAWRQGSRSDAERPRP